MKFTCEKHFLQEAITTVSRCTATKSPMPALEGILIQAEDTVKMTGYDLKKGIYTFVRADVIDPGSIVLNSKLFGEIVRSLPDNVVMIDSGDGLKTHITCGASEFFIMGTDSRQYPELPVVKKESSLSVPQGILNKMIRECIFAISTNESRPIYTGALMEIKDGELIMVSVDGFRMALRKERISEQEYEYEDCSFVVPGSALQDLEKLCGDKEDKVEINVGEKHISFSLGNTVLLSRRLEGEFLNYSKSIPSIFTITVDVNREEILKAVSRVSLVIEEKVKNPLKLKIEENNIKIFCNTNIGQGEDQCSIKNGGGNLEIGFNNVYLLDALRAASSDELRFCFNNAASPCVIVPADGSNSFSYMILPVRLKSGS